MGRNMKFTRENKPADMPRFRKSSTVQLLFVAEPFEVETQEGPTMAGMMVISSLTPTMAASSTLLRLRMWGRTMWSSKTERTAFCLIARQNPGWREHAPDRASGPGYNYVVVACTNAIRQRSATQLRQTGTG
jgi:hypothetical protein